MNWKPMREPKGELHNMGLFDDLRCKYPLPVEGANELEFQTKDTPSQYMDCYEIREDGTLWHEEYDIEDRSQAGLWRKDHPGEEPPENLERFIGCMARANKHWVFLEKFIGEIRFYTTLGKAGWLEFSAYFVQGEVNQLHLIEHRADNRVT